jgi:hypothetical protein
MELTIEVKESEADFLIELLEKFDFVKVKKTPEESEEQPVEPTFRAVEIKRPGLTFTREEANER